jgi:putative phosphoribosyl transferase
MIRDQMATSREVAIPAFRALLPGTLTLPARCSALVLFAMGNGTGHRNAQNRLVADALQQAGFGTLLFDMLTPEEAADRRNSFDIVLLAGRLHGARCWVGAELNVPGRALGYFGASTGAAAALVAEAAHPHSVAAIVTHGRPDLAGEALPRVTAPTLLIAGADDEDRAGLNQRALSHLECPTRLELVPGAALPAPAPSTLQRAADLAVAEFRELLSRAAA